MPIFAAKKRQATLKKKLVLQQGDELKKESLNIPSWAPFKLIDHGQAANDQVLIPQKPEVPGDALKDHWTPKTVRIYPTSKQKEILHLWLTATRHMYNLAVAERIRLGKEAKENGTKVKMKLKHLREVMPLKKNFDYERDPKLTYLKNVPFLIKDNGLRDFDKDYRTNLAKSKNTLRPFKIHFKKIKDKQSMTVEKKVWGLSRGIYHDVFRKGAFRSTEPLPEQLPHDSRLIREHGKWFLVIPYETSGLMPKKEAINAVAVDPGVRTFLTTYDSSQRVLEIGEDGYLKLQHLDRRLRSLQSEIHKLRSKGIVLSKEDRKRKIRNRRTVISRLYQRKKNLANDVHRKASHLLASKYNYILIPVLNFHNFKKTNRRVKANLANMKHCLFVQRLKNKASHFENTTVIEVDEEFTTKTCSLCGVRSNIGASKVFKCDNCDATFDRDHNAAKNILLKYLGEID
ncbi:AGL264Wp [Eremothecium gossypii ATCC 10895]|uniref:AGL264Wp n=1 Tax=Eremothecium gossypii (strain ATCC 10895 / CBS 109.51 / FGSC 9923 / NRRL Y-1056) TaxID=284811 RepID=Q751H0_EREGS|nr:AGL264Wp [Eremothecium gossypii ATCC 10895]AAS54227.1 AGL264Wp [Eremothecium gossypii ATCC 10895]AEY98553.1 FAGL264Wp [Eremothecium gossypii FDAG1]